MTIEEIINEIEKRNSGLELNKRKGILTSTWLLYKRDNDFYFFDINEDIIFDKYHRYSQRDLVERFKDSYFEIENEVS